MSQFQRGSDQHGLALRLVESGCRQADKTQRDEIIAEIGREIVFDPDVLDTYTYEGWAPVHHDLLVVCAAVEYADRMCARRQTHWSRRLDVTIPVRDIAAWQRKEVQVCLRNTLRQLTGDDWNLKFVSACQSDVSVTRQRSLPLGVSRKFAIAFSDGLDSCCVTGLLDSGGGAVCVRVIKRKKRVKREAQPFDQIPFDVKIKSARDSGARSRGFKFAAITAIAGQLSNVSTVIVPESGQGALGPVLLPLHNVYPDYRNHPTFFREMERFVRALLGYAVAFQQPRLWYTKGQTISAYAIQSSECRDAIRQTRSCWQQRWNVRVEGKRRQCGLCAACLLRRMSMHAAGIDEPDDAYFFSDLTVDSYEAAVPSGARTSPGHVMVEYGSVGARHLHDLAGMATVPDSELSPHAFDIARATGASEQETRENLRSLLIQHAEEWRRFVYAQGQGSFLNSWIIGGRYGRYE